MSWSWTDCYQCGSRNMQNCRKCIILNYEAVTSLCEAPWCHVLGVLHNKAFISTIRHSRDQNVDIFNNVHVFKPWNINTFISNTRLIRLISILPIRVLFINYFQENSLIRLTLKYKNMYSYSEQMSTLWSNAKIGNQPMRMLFI